MKGNGFRHDDLPKHLEATAAQLVDVVVEVRRALGAGLFESVYVDALCHELGLRGIPWRRDFRVPLLYKGQPLGKAFVPDILVAEEIIVEAKAVESLHPTHFAQILTYLRLSGKPLGFLVNFHAVPLSNGIHRKVNFRASL